MASKKVDVAIIGTGSAGMAAYRAARKHTDHLALIEGGEYGTTCARVGCMPSKLLIAAAEAAHAIDEAAGFGIHLQDRPQINGVEVMQRVRSERDRFVGFVLETVEDFDPQHRIRGFAHFLDDHTLEVADQRIEARAIVIATGSSPNVLPIFAKLGDRLIVNDDVFSWTDLPKSVVVFGPGVIGMELGQSLHRLGVRVRIFGQGGFLRAVTDPEVRRYMEKTLKAELSIDSDANVQQIQRDGDEVLIRFLDQGQMVEERFDYVLAATGRKPNVHNLQLKNTNLELDSNGVPLFDTSTMQCGSSHVFIAGDVNSQLPLLHEAADEGRIAGDNAGRYPEVQPGKRSSLLNIVFSDPQIALVGQSWSDLEEGRFLTGRVSFENQGRSRVMRKNKGLMHVYAERQTGRFLGAEIFGPHAEHLGHLLAWAHQQKLTIPQMLEMPFYHPAIEEGLRTALRDVNAQFSQTTS